MDGRRRADDASVADGLAERLGDVLTWAAEAVPRLDALSPWWTEEGDGFVRLRDKVAGEALLLAFLASRLPSELGLGDACTAIADAAAAEVVTPRNEAILRRFPQTAVSLGLGYIVLAELGRASQDILALIDRAIDRRLVNVSERSPFRLMEVRWAAHMRGRDGLGRPEDVLPFSILSASPHPIHTTTDDEYAFTHALFYLTDFGRRALDGQVDAEALAEAVDAFILAAAVRADLDLLGELLACSIMLRTPTSLAARFGWRVLFDAWDDGVHGLVGPGYSPARFAELRGVEAEAYWFAENYHTVFVGGILCAVALALPPQGPAPAVDAPGDAAEAMVARLLDLRGEPVEPPPPWMRAVTGPSFTRPELVALLFDAAVLEAVRQYHLVHLADLLAWGSRHPGLHTSTFGRAVEFLGDQRLDDGSVGIHGLLRTGGDDVWSEAQRAIAGSLAVLQERSSRQQRCAPAPRA